MVCDIFKSKNINYTYRDTDDYDVVYRTKMLCEAIELGFTSFPLIFNETENRFVNFEDVICI